MQDEAEEPAKPKSTEPTRVEIFLVGAAWALFVATLIVGFRTWSGGWH
ncbi:MAG: hypothetical protein ABIR60_06805 [Allosphingosinicella sp.]